MSPFCGSLFGLVLIYRLPTALISACLSSTGASSRLRADSQPSFQTSVYPPLYLCPLADLLSTRTERQNSPYTQDQQGWRARGSSHWPDRQVRSADQGSLVEKQHEVRTSWTSLFLRPTNTFFSPAEIRLLSSILSPAPRPSTSTPPSLTTRTTSNSGRPSPLLFPPRLAQRSSLSPHQSFGEGSRPLLRTRAARTRVVGGRC